MLASDEVEAVDEVIVAVEAEEAIEEVEETEEEEEEMEIRTECGSLSPSSEDSFKTERSRRWNRFTSSRCPLRWALGCRNRERGMEVEGGRGEQETGIIDYFFKGESLKDEVMKIMPVQKQTAAGQRTRFKAFVVVGDFVGHIGLGVKVASEVATAIRGAISSAKLALVPIRLGFWGTKIGAPHTVPVKVHGKCGSVIVRLVPAPRGTGIVAPVCVKKVLNYAGVKDVYTNSTGCTKTLGNFIKVGCF